MIIKCLNVYLKCILYGCVSLHLICVFDDSDKLVYMVIFVSRRIVEFSEGYRLRIATTVEFIKDLWFHLFPESNIMQRNFFDKFSAVFVCETKAFIRLKEGTTNGKPRIIQNCKSYANCFITKSRAHIKLKIIVTRQL